MDVGPSCKSSFFFGVPELILQQHHRPWVAFDPKSADHRRYFADFLKYRTWGKSPVRFIIAEDHSGDLLQLIHASLARYYTQKEFGEIDS